MIKIDLFFCAINRFFYGEEEMFTLSESKALEHQILSPILSLINMPDIVWPNDSSQQILIS